MWMKFVGCNMRTSGRSSFLVLCPSTFDLRALWLVSTKGGIDRDKSSRHLVLHVPLIDSFPASTSDSIMAGILLTSDYCDPF